MRELLLVEDHPKDQKVATDVAQELGFTKIEARHSVAGACAYLEKGLRGETGLPDCIVLDLDLGIESGFELLRLWHSTPKLSPIPIVVWSVLDRQKELCDLFKVSSFVSKWQGPRAFREALGKLVS